MCQQWADSRSAFIEYIKANIPNWDDEGLDIDRIDNEKGYEPGNIRLVKRVINSRNRRSNIKIEYKGREYVVAEFGERHVPHMSRSTLYWHVRNGKSAEQIMAVYRSKTRI